MWNVISKLDSLTELDRMELLDNTIRNLEKKKDAYLLYQEKERQKKWASDIFDRLTAENKEPAISLEQTTTCPESKNDKETAKILQTLLESNKKSNSWTHIYGFVGLLGGLATLYSIEWGKMFTKAPIPIPTEKPDVEIVSEPVQIVPSEPIKSPRKF